MYILLVLFPKQTISEIQFHKHILKVNFLPPFGMNTKPGYSNSPHTFGNYIRWRSSLHREKAGSELKAEQGKESEHNSFSWARHPYEWTGICPKTTSHAHVGRTVKPISLERAMSLCCGLFRELLILPCISPAF